MSDEIKETAEVSIMLLTRENWEEKMAAVKESGAQMAAGLLEQGQVEDRQILAPREMPGADPKATQEENSVQLAAAVLDIDWKIEIKREMVEMARDILTAALLVGSLSPSLPTVLAAIIEGRGLVEYSIGEFFLLYGRFEQKHCTSDKETGARMETLVKGDQKLMRRYVERGKTTLQPLPYAVRNILSHVGTNPNRLDKEGNDLRTSIELLRGWVK
ncbi:MAG: hypothetical protein OXI11_00660 [Gammaproteobacteria bacterium]|nr:hypothetical protein [Gammaproteobacteria bacterium]MYE48231.1 hypothetical protein [Gammaproteobacteria bacterium]